MNKQTSDSDSADSGQSDYAEPVGVILVDHGSRRAESNDLLLKVAEMYRQSSTWEIVEPAHMELAEPTIADAFSRCVARGARTVVVFPYFLSPGRHWNEDIPHLVKEAAADHPGIASLVTAPLGLHPLMAEIMTQRISHCLDHATGKAEKCAVCTNKETGCEFR